MPPLLGSPLHAARAPADPPPPCPAAPQTAGCAVAGGFCAVSYATVDRSWDYQMQGLLEIGRTTFIIVILLVRGPSCRGLN